MGGMDREEKFVLGKKPSPDEDLYLEGYGKGWGEKLTFTVGISYLAGGAAGVISPPIKLALGKLLRWNLDRERITLTSVSKHANRGACLSLMFCMTGKFLDLVFEEELNDLNLHQKFMVTGALTGAVYKSTLGMRPMVVGSIFGAGLIYAFSQGLGYLNHHGMVNYRFDF
jgi:import inner membrane translocase subunit TIM23